MTAPLHSSPETDPDRIGDLLESAIRDIGIPPCPTILEDIHTEMGKSEPDFKHLTRIISSDVGIAAGLITITNSPFFGLRNRVRSVNEALMMLGLDVASRAVAGLVLRRMFPPTTLGLERFWHASASIARLSGWLAQQAISGIRVSPDDAYTFGLFRDCGIPLMLKRFSHYPEVMNMAGQEKVLTFTAVEDNLCTTNHALVGGLLAQGWWLPDETSLAIRHHHDFHLLEQGSSSGLSTTTLGLIANAQVAEQIFLRHNLAWERTQEWFKAGEACMRLLGLSDDDLAQYCSVRKI
ncbi:MAG: HDOD domain-containing protein [Nitrosomonadales bacterium]|nr:HDOD domain-containing protein [Nitrosomonadales bacterium]